MGRLVRIFLSFTCIFVFPLCGVQVCGAQIGGAQEPPSIADFVEDGTDSSFSLSPSGHMLALLREDDGANYIEIRDLQTDSVLRRLQHPEYRFWNVEWYDNERVLLTASKPYVIHNNVKMRVERAMRKSGDDRTIYDHSRLYIMNIDGSQFIRLFKNKSRLYNHHQSISVKNIVDVLKDDPDHLLMKSWGIKGAVLWKTNTKTGATERVENGRKASTTNWMTNSNGVPTIRYDSYKGGRIVGISVRAEGEGEWNEIIKLREEDLEDFRPITPTQDPKVFIVSALKDGEDRVAFYKYDLAERQLLEKVYGHDEVDVNTIVFDTDYEPIGYSYIVDHRDYAFTDPDFSKRYALLKSKLEANQNITLKEVSKDRRFWLLRTSSPTNPGTYYYFDSKNAELTKYAVGSTLIETNQLGKMERIDYQASDGMAISGYLTHPAKPSATLPPLIVFPHGGPEARDSSDYDVFVQFFASRGYMVFQPNFRGSSGYGRKFSEAGYGQWGLRMQDDITDGVKYLAKSGKVDIDNMCIAGFSYGGYAALMGAVKTPDLYKCAISMNGVADLNDILKYDKTTLGAKSLGYKYVKKTIGDPKKDQAKISANSPIEQVEKMKIPILIIHGEHDTIVPVRQGRKMSKALQKLGRDVEYLEIERSGHNLIRSDGTEKTLTKLESYLAEHLPVTQ